MTAVKDFDADREKGTPVVFTLSGQEFHAKPRLNWDTITTWTKKRDDIGEGYTYVEWVLWLIYACLTKADHERFAKAISFEDDDPKSVSDLDEIASWLIEQYTGNVGGRSSESQAGSPKTNSSGSAGASSAASAPKTSTRKRASRSPAS